MVEYKRQQQSERNTGMKRRIFLIVLDSVGIGAMEDAAEFGDAGCNTLRSASRSSRFRLTNMENWVCSILTESTGKRAWKSLLPPTAE